MNITYQQQPHIWRQKSWGQIQMRLFQEDCKIRREKNLEDYIINNGVGKVYVLKDNVILDQFFKDQETEVVKDPANAELIIITDQRFSRLTANNMLEQLNRLLDNCPRIYFCLNRYYLNASETIVDSELPEHYDTAIVRWFEKNLPNTIVLNRSEIFPEDGSYFTWVVPSCELLICRT
jgi:hypothetical protein